MTDPRMVLGVAADAGDEEIRAAYLRKVKEHPPDKSPDEFERIRDAYEILRDPRRRARELFVGDAISLEFQALADGLDPRRSYVGTAPWLEVLRGK